MILKTKLLWIILTLVSFALVCYAEDTTVKISKDKKYEIKLDTTEIDVKPYSTEGGYTFTPDAKPKYYDPIYHGMSPFFGVESMMNCPMFMGK